ncbi:hypothetical protein PCNPT3_07080 [Psychromonas sp. CNPT3]|uniref:hypothetical protein n=1 Tax=Psychromonas sp. CNPT3 TaxID=314282 RepID=UPI00006E3C07|nr:hypothetical protein [Psychromonas sp. CNPT3]AGH81354.1 hypothetical protein PCNPT3_07080 [Psychromonas sp. CNPT3]
MIRNYKKNDLKSGFVGVRVAVSVGGKLKQKWFANSLFAQPTAMRLAEDLENKWLGMQLQHQRNNVISLHSNAGFIGICFCISLFIISQPPPFFFIPTFKKNVIMRFTFN